MRRDRAAIPTAIDEEALAAYHRELAEQATIAFEPPTVIGGCPWPDHPLAVVDHGEWTAEGGITWESEREDLIRQLQARRMANAGNRAAERLGVSLVDGEVAE